MTTSRGAPVTYSLAPGQSIEYRCSPSGAPPVSTGYCLAVESFQTTLVINGRQTVVPEYGAGLATASPDDNYDLCVTGPTQHTSCTTYPFSPSVGGFRVSAVVCGPDAGAGDYAISWHVRGVDLGMLTYHAPFPAVNVPCVAPFGDAFMGGSSANLPADVKGVNRYSLPTAGSLLWLGIYLSPTGIPGQQVMKGIVYADSNGVPGALLGITNELTYRGSPAGWYYPRFPTPLQLPAGNYWIGVISGPQSNVARFYFDNVTGSLDFDSNPYTAGPSDPFGPISTSDERLSLFAGYTASKP